jgi:cell volume regulation protein A
VASNWWTPTVWEHAASPGSHPRRRGAALVVILFDGGVPLGWSRVRPRAGAVVTLGFAGMLVNAGVMALAAHALFGFGWATSAVQVSRSPLPTDGGALRHRQGPPGRATRDDPGSRVRSQRSDCDRTDDRRPGGDRRRILASHRHHHAVRQLAIGLVVGVAGAWLTRKPLRHLTEPRDTPQDGQVAAESMAAESAASASPSDSSGR